MVSQPILIVYVCLWYSNREVIFAHFYKIYLKVPNSAINAWKGNYICSVIVTCLRLSHLGQVCKTEILDTNAGLNNISFPFVFSPFVFS